MTQVRIDDLSISNEEIFLRHIYFQDHIKPDGSLSSAAFSDRSQEISGDLASMTTTEAIIRRSVNTIYGFGELLVGDARTSGAIAVRDPVEDNDAHALICPRSPLSENDWRRFRKRLSKIATLIIEKQPTTTE